MRRIAWIVIVGSLDLIANDSLAATIDLSLPPIPHTGPPPHLMVDVDGDGRVDAVGPGETGVNPGYGLFVWRGLGEGLFAPPEVYLPVPIPPQVLAGADLDGDGDVDLVAVYQQVAVAVLSNAGDGTFGTPSPYQVLPNEIRSHAIGDVDGDGDLDLVMSVWNSSSYNQLAAVVVVRTLAGNVLGTPTVYSFGSTLPGAVALGDCNGDGSLDIAMSLLGTYLPNSGNGSFGLPLALGPMETGQWIIAAELGGTPDTDFVIVAQDHTTVLLSADPQSFAATRYNFPNTVPPLLTDLDRDGFQDLTLVSRATCTVLWGTESGTFQPTSYAVPTGGVDRTGVQAADLDQDGRRDLVITGGKWLVPLWGQGGSFRIGSPYGPIRNGWIASVADVDQDGAEDLLFQFISDRFETPLSDAPMSIAVSRQAPSIPEGATLLQVLDFDADGEPDVLADDTVLRGLGDGEFASVCNLSLPGTGSLHAAVVTDLNQDGLSDLGIVRSDGTGGGVVVVLGSGGVCPFGAGILYAAGTSPTSIASGDFDGDGDVDLISNGWANSIVLLPNDGTGAFESPKFIDFGSPSPGLAAADFDGDGDLDIAANGRDLAVLYNQGGGSFATPTRIFGGCGGGVSVADFDMDGDADILSVCRGSFYVLTNQGGGTFVLASAIGRGNSWSLCIGDFDGELGPDVASFYHTSSPEVDHLAIFANRGDATFDVAADRQVSDAAKACVAADFTSDGRIDMLTPGVLYPNRTDVRTPVIIEDLHAEWTEAGVRLAWTLRLPLGGDITGIRLQRSEASAGPWADLHAQPLEPETHGSFLDTGAPRGGESWYRIVLVTIDQTLQMTPPVHVAGSETPRSAIHSVVQRDDALEIRFAVSGGSPVRLAVHDVRGRSLREWRLPGNHPGEFLEIWDGRDVQGKRLVRGIYIASLWEGGRRTARKFMFAPH